MAAAVDSFDFLAREIIGVFTSIRDILALVGAAFAAKRTLSLSGTAWEVIRVHGLARLFPERNFAKRYGPWAGSRSSISWGSDGSATGGGGVRNTKEIVAV